MSLPTPHPPSPIAKYSCSNRDQPPPSPPKLLDDFTKPPIFSPNMPNEWDLSGGTTPPTKYLSPSEEPTKSHPPRSSNLKHKRSPERASTTDQYDSSASELRDSRSTISSYKTALGSPSLVSLSAAYGPFTPTKIFTPDPDPGNSENLLSLREALAMKNETEPPDDDSTQHRDDQAEDRDFAVGVFNKIGEGWGGGIREEHKAGNSSALAGADGDGEWDEHTYSLENPVEDYVLANPIDNYFPASSISSSMPKPNTTGSDTCRCAHDTAPEVLLVGVSGAPAHGRRTLVDILRAFFTVTAVISQDEYALAPVATRPSVITKRSLPAPTVPATSYNFDVEKLSARLIDIKSSSHPIAPSHNRNDQLNNRLISTLHTLSQTLHITPHDRIAILEGPYLYSYTHLLTSLIDVRLQLLDHKFLPWEDSFGTWRLRSPFSPSSSSPSTPIERQLLHTAVWRQTSLDYDMRLRTAGNLVRDLGIRAEESPVPVYESPVERMGEWAVRCVCEGLVDRRVKRRGKAREEVGGRDAERDRKSREMEARSCWGRFLKWSCVLAGAGVVSRVLVGRLWKGR